MTEWEHRLIAMACPDVIVQPLTSEDAALTAAVNLVAMGLLAEVGKEPFGGFRWRLTEAGARLKYIDDGQS